MEIKKSTDYDLFKVISNNRPIGTKSVRTLIKSITENDLTPYKPIIVDSEFNIIDGQHRYEACRLMNKPIYFVQLDREIDSEQAMITLNMYQKNWKQEEFLNFHAQTKGKQWKELQDFENKYKLGISNSVVVFPNVGIGSKDIRNGEREFSKAENADAIAEFLLSDEVKILRFGRTRPFVLAVKKAFERYNDKQLKKLKRKLVYIQMSANYEQYLTAFENLIK